MIDVQPSHANSSDMKNVKIASAALLLCVIQGAGARTLKVQVRTGFWAVHRLALRRG